MTNTSQQPAERILEGTPVDISYDRDEHLKNDIFYAAVETTRMPMIVTNPRLVDNPIVFANRAFLEMTGYASEEIVGSNCRFLQGKDTDPDAVAEIREAIARDRELATEILNYRKDGSTFWNALFISPVYDRDGQLIYFRVAIRREPPARR